MERRTVIKQLFCIAGAAVCLPLCKINSNKSSILLKNISINEDQEKLMAELSETIIPVTETPGAKDMAAHTFVLMMVDDCYEKKDQEKFMMGLTSFETKINIQFNKSFIECTAAEKNTMLKELDRKASDSTALDFFYVTVKKLTIQAFTTSKVYLTKVKMYQMIPGHFYGCIPVKKVG